MQRTVLLFMKPLFSKILIKLIVGCCCLAAGKLYAQDSNFIKVQFIYGSKPLKKYRATEKKWFGGLPGGHVGIETDSSMVLDFHHVKSFHVFTAKKNKHSHFLLKPAKEFWCGFGCPEERVKKGTVIIPVTPQQKQRFDSIANSYLLNSPYDYALFGMRCASATYDILSQIGVVERYSLKTTYMKIFYPKKLRLKLYAKAKEMGWAVVKQEGTSTRKWEQD